MISAMTLICALLTGLAAAPESGGNIPLPPDGSVIVFFGDSITQAGWYVEYVDAFLAARYPYRAYRILNRGISSETLSGTSEPDHAPPRPNAHDRFDRDVAAARPDVVVACFGMNDGNYFPFDRDRFERFQAGVRRLIDRTRTKKAELILLTPPVYDAYARKVLDPQAVSFGYKFPAIDYDLTLQWYSAWLRSLREPSVQVVDLRTPMQQHLHERRRRQVSFVLQEDGIHPTPTGHWLMAAVLLAAWGAKDQGDAVHIDTQARRASPGVSGLELGPARIKFTWKTRLPMPRADEWDLESIALLQRMLSWQRHELLITGLRPGQYQLRAAGQDVATRSAEQLNRGLDLLALEKFPTTRLSRKLLQKIQQRQRLEVALWRSRVVDTQPASRTRPAAELETGLRALKHEIRALCAPREISIELAPVKVP